MNEIRWDRVRKAKHRIASGFYDNPDVVVEVAGKLLKDAESVEPDGQLDLPDFLSHDR